MRTSSLVLTAALSIVGSVVWAECTDDLEGIDNSASLDGKPLEGYSARTPEDFAVAAINALHDDDPNNTLEKIVAHQSWSIIREEDRWAEIMTSSVTGQSLPTQSGAFVGNNFAVCADNGQCAQVDFQLNFVREDNVSSNFINQLMDAALNDAWESDVVTAGMPHTYVYDVQSYTVLADLNGDLALKTIPTGDTLDQTFAVLGGLFQPSSYGTAEERAAIHDKTCRDNSGAESQSGGSGGANAREDDEPYEEPWAEWERSWGYQVRCWYIFTEQQTYSNCD